MRILHFMNTPLSIDELKSGGKQLNTSGGWMAALLGRMLKDTDFTFACVAFGKVKKVQMSHDDRIDCFVVPGDLVGRSLDHTLRVCRDLVGQWKPDLIHIHGTEAAYGLLTARGMVKCPAVISLQGLLGPYSEWYRYFGNSSVMDIVRMHRWLEIPRDARPLDKILENAKNGEKGAGDHCRQPVLYGAHSLGPGIHPCPESLRTILPWWRTAAGGVLARTMEHRTSPATPDHFY